MSQPSPRFRYQPLVIVTSLVGLVVGCNDVTPVIIQSPDVPANEAPSIDVLEPNEDLPISQGESFIVRWTDTDPDDNAAINIALAQVDGSSVINIADGLLENDTTEDLFAADTSDVPLGEYFLRLTINDGSNSNEVVFAEDSTTGNRVVITITPPGLGSQNTPPQIFVAAPEVNAGVSQNDLLSIVIRPTIFVPGLEDPGEQFHYDREDPADVVILLDLDDNPENDDFDSDDDPGNIILQRLFIDEGRFDEITTTVVVDVQEIPVRRDGQPYYVRATISDGLNVAHAYSSGRLHVLELVKSSASPQREIIDLNEIGRTLAGAKFLGFNPNSNLGTKMSPALDQDNDGIGDFVVVAQYGNARNRGNLGEAYLVYGTPGLRFGGEISINSVGADAPVTSLGRVRGTVFATQSDRLIGGVVELDQGDDRRIWEVDDLSEPYTLGVTDVVAIEHLGTPDSNNFGAETGDCTIPELLFGVPHSEYMATTQDQDPGDNPEDELCTYCYPDDQPNNYCSDFHPLDPDDPVGEISDYFEGSSVIRLSLASEEKLGTVALFYGENGLVQTDVEAVDDNVPCSNNIAPTTEVVSMTSCGSQAEDVQVNFGARFNVAIFDNFGEQDDHNGEFPINPLNAHFGMNVGVLEDVDLNGFPEVIVSAPRNEIEVRELQALSGDSHPHLVSRLSGGNITVYLGQDFSGAAQTQGTAHIPAICDNPALCNPPSCSDPFIGRTIVRSLDVYAAGAMPVPGWFFIRGEEPEDKLGNATSAGDFNLDGPADVLAGAPFADPELDLDNNGFPETTVEDAGTVYVFYLRLPFGNIEAASGDFKDRPDIFPRSPMLRIFGESALDHLGLQQEAGGDINGDGIDDIFIGSGDYNGLGLTNNGFVGIVFGGQRIDGDRTVSQIATTELSGTRIYGTNDGDQAGHNVSQAGDFNGDGVGDLLISAPGETVTVGSEDKPRRGVVYLIFGGKHLENRVFTLDQVGTETLPGIVFAGPYQQDTPDAYELDAPVFVRTATCDPDDDIECICDPEIEESCGLLEGADGTTELRQVADAAPDRVGFVGDVNGDGFDDIMIGNPTADVFDPTQPGEARRKDAGEAYLIYGNNFGSSGNAQ